MQCEILSSCVQQVNGFHVYFSWLFPLLYLGTGRNNALFNYINCNLKQLLFGIKVIWLLQNEVYSDFW